MNKGYINIKMFRLLLWLLGDCGKIKEEFKRRRRKGLLAQKIVCMYDFTQVTHFNNLHFLLQSQEK